MKKPLRAPKVSARRRGEELAVDEIGHYGRFERQGTLYKSVGKFFGSETKFFVQLRTIGQTTVHHRHNIGLRADANLLFGIRGVGCCANRVDTAHNLLEERIAQPAFFHGQANFKIVARLQRAFEFEFGLRHDNVDAAAVKIGKLYAARFDELVPACFEIVEVVGIVHNALNVAFIIANAHGKRKNEIHDNSIYNGLIGRKKQGTFARKLGTFSEKRPTFLRYARSFGRLIASLYRKWGLLRCFWLAAMGHIRTIFAPSVFGVPRKTLFSASA